jgi:hypothetical protein
MTDDLSLPGVTGGTCLKGIYPRCGAHSSVVTENCYLSIYTVAMQNALGIRPWPNGIGRE